MGDNFFDGTLDDFAEFDVNPDHAFLELASLALPLGSPSPPRSLRVSPIRSAAFEPLPISRLHGRHTVLDLPSFFDRRVREASALLSSDLGPALDNRPTRPDPSNRPTPAPAAGRLEHSRLNPSPRPGDNPNPLSFPPGSASPHLPVRPAILAALNPTRGAFPSNLPLHGLPTFPPSPTHRHSGNLANERLPRSIPRSVPCIPAQLQVSHSNNASDSAGAARLAAARLPRRPTGQTATPEPRTDKSSLRQTIMSSSTRRRTSVRPVDLTLPSTSSQPPASSRSTARTTRRSASRALQPEPSSSGNKRKREVDFDDDLFGDAFAGQEVVDLVDKDEIPVDIRSTQEKNKNYVRLSAFDCVICMDNVKDLTVTHCGHLFCSECLHSALNMGQTRSICPICRQKIDKMPVSGRFPQRGKGFYPLELKLTTKRTLGRRPGQSSQGSV